MVPWCLNEIFVTVLVEKSWRIERSRFLETPVSQPWSRWPVSVPFPLNSNELLHALPTSSCLRKHEDSIVWPWQRLSLWKKWLLDNRLWSKSEQQEAPEESKQPRMKIDVSQWLVVKFVTSTLLLCYCRLTKVLCSYWPSAPCSYR